MLAKLTSICKEAEEKKTVVNFEPGGIFCTAIEKFWENAQKQSDQKLQPGEKSQHNFKDKLVAKAVNVFRDVDSALNRIVVMYTDDESLTLEQAISQAALVFNPYSNMTSTYGKRGTMSKQQKATSVSNLRLFFEERPIEKDDQQQLEYRLVQCMVC